MQSYLLKDITNIVAGDFFGSDNVAFNKLVTDSRKINHFGQSLFIAIVGNQHDGHKYIQELYDKGVRSFIVSEKIQFQIFPNAGFIKVKNTISALQSLAAFKRSSFNIPIIGITGSNGKTIVKEWIFWLLNSKYKITRSPKSYNSQLGVPLSLWLLENDTELGIFEAGISQVNEMEVLEKIIHPNIGIITNIGSAHQANFDSVSQKTDEKLKLFKNCETVIYDADCIDISEKLYSNKNIKSHITWSEKQNGLINIIKIKSKNEFSKIYFQYLENEFSIRIPFSDKGSIHNAITCLCVLIALKTELSPTVLNRFSSLPNIEMRLQMLNGIQNSTIINDSYNSDINSLEIALDYLNQKKANKKSVLIMSDILQSSQNELELYKSVSKIVKEKKISRFIGIGESLSKTTQLFPENSKFYSNTDSFLSDIVYSDYSDTAILLKGARDFKFEKISNKLQSKNHETVIEIDLNLMKFNLQQFKSLLKPETKMMVMVKAFSYGSGYQEVASFLQHNRIDYLAVAFADEGVELRNGGIEIPIMVMNPSSHSFKTMIEYKLEPEIYSISILKELVKELRNSNIENFPIHIKLDTGMHRLGLMEADLEEFCTIIKDSKKINIASIFTHLSGSDSSSFDTFTNQQAEVFGKMYKHICKLSNSKPDRHLANSAGIIRFPEYHFEMVRLGIGLYGLIPELSNDLIPVSRFKSVISQIRNVSKGESVSYNRSGKIEKESVIATIPVGYADGLDRRLGNGNWEFIINEKSAKTVGDICMDMCMIDITGIDAKEGDEVLIFSEKNSINKMAKILKTIPYEVITGISQRVKRVYFEE